MGYTNSGKSAIMNRLLQLSEREDKTVSSQNMLFATLDTQHRKITLEQGSEFILIDTVGFVSRLPHSLVEAFKSTLEEVRYADLLVQTVVDSSYENRDFYMEVTNKVIEQIGAGDKDQIVAYNKMDIAKSVPLDVSGHEVVYLSAKTGENINVLVEKIREKIFGGRVEMTLLIPYQRGDITSYLCENAQIFSMEYEEEGTLLHGKLEREDALRYGSFAVDPGEKSEGIEMELYKTVRKQAEAVQVIDKSRFIAHVFPVESREEADAFLAEIREKYKDATHNVPAMVIGDKSQIQWASDDGEPQGTSGAPMVQMMVKEGLTNLIVVVTRYFGGIKLGTGGLVRAYTSSAKLGLEAAGVCSVREMAELTVKIDYPYLAKIQNMASEQLDLEEADREGKENLSNFRIANIQYTDKIEMKIQTFPGSLTNVELLFQNITSGKAEVISQTTVREKV